MPKIYEYNIEEFTQDNEYTYYLLGLIASDEVIEKYHTKIGLKDLELIEKIRDLIVPEKPIYHNKRDNTWYLKISNKRYVDFIRNAGLTERKSFTLKMNDEILKSNNFRHFIRGYFDGDGTVDISRNTNGKSNKSYYKTSMRICSASIDILLQIQNFLVEEYGLNKNKIVREKNNTFFRLKFQGKQADMFYNIIYTDATIYLNRKFNRYSNLVILDSNQKEKYYGNGKEGIAPLDNRLL